MSLQDELKAKALALVSQQMAGWVVEIQRSIQRHQGDLVRSLDVLQETVARYDERIDEAAIGRAIEEVVAKNPPAPSGPGCDRLRAAITELEKGTSLSEVLTHLVNEVSNMVPRVAMFIVKGSSAIGWYGRGFDQPEMVKQLNIPLNADTVFRIVQNSRHALRGHITHSPGTGQALARLGGGQQGVLAVPLILRDKLSAILYSDSTEEEIPLGDCAFIEVLVLFAAKTIDLLSLAPKTAGQQAAAAAPAAAPAPPPTSARMTSGSTMDRVASLRSAPPAAPVEDEGGSTVMFRGGGSGVGRVAPTPAARPAAPPPQAVAPEDQKAHEDAKRFARLVVSEIKLYNEQKVLEGRRQKNIYEVLKDDIERGRQMYSDRVPAHIRDVTNYFYDELVRILAGGDASALGPI
jgi:hypothetical protein